MATLSKPPTAVVALLAIGAIWWLSQRRAIAGGVNPAYLGASQTPAVQRYMVGPSGVVPTVAPQPTTAQSVLQFAAALLGGQRSTPASAGAGYSLLPAGFELGGSALFSPVPGFNELPAVSTPASGSYSWGGPLTSSNPLTGAYGYADGAGVADQVAASLAPNVDPTAWLQESDVDPLGYF